jgi:GNAT superfamily N-acetyltransferase
LPLSAPTPLTEHHVVKGFDCGYPALNQWLVRYALANQRAGAARTFVVGEGDGVIGYYSLAAGGVAPADAPPRIRKGLARHPIPVMLLARLAVDRRHQGQGIGRALLGDAVLRTLNVADPIGVRALLVHAKDEKARAFYERFDFEPSPTDPLHLMLLIKDARRTVEAGEDQPTRGQF